MPRQAIHRILSRLYPLAQCLFWAAFTTLSARAGDLSLSPIPLLQTTKVPPNILLVLNDSYHSQGQAFSYKCTLGACNEPGRLDYLNEQIKGPYINLSLFNVDDDHYADVYLDVVPTVISDRNVMLAPSDESQPYWGYWLGRYYEWNQTYYNPNVTYKPWPGYNDADPAAARLYPGNVDDTTVIDLTQPVTYYSKNHNHRCTRKDRSDCVKVENYYIPRYYEITKDFVYQSQDCSNSKYPACSHLHKDREDQFWNDCVDSGNCPYDIDNRHDSYDNKLRTARGPDIMDEYRLVEIKPATPNFIHGTAKMPARRDDCSKLQDYQYSCSYAQEIQNFANWYVYYRDRFKLAKAGLVAAVDALPQGVRAGYFSYFDSPYWYLCGSHCTARIHNAVPVTEIKDDADREALKAAILKGAYRSGQNWEGDMGAVATAALYLRGDFAQAKAAWASPILAANAGGSCQQNYLILGAGVPGFGGRPREGGMFVSNGHFSGPASWHDLWYDHIERALWNYGDYSSPQGEAPYMNFTVPWHSGWEGDDYAWNALGNATLWAYAEDLRPDLPDLVPTQSGTEFKAAHQHLETYTIGLGAPIGLDPFDEKTPTWEGDSDPWNAQFAWMRDRIFNADSGQLWHAALAGRGKFLAGANVDAIKDAFKDVVLDIKARLATLGTPSLNQIAEGDLIYVPSFRSPAWVGEVEALKIPTNADGSTGALTDAVVQWKASAKLDAQDWDSGRTILTFNGQSGRGVAFRWPADPANPGVGEMDKAMADALIGAGDADLGRARLEYLRGNRVYEDDASDPHFRPRDTVLGDVVHSGPSYVAAPAFHYPDALEPTDLYSAFKTGTAKDRTPMLYFGANDGMLHGLDAQHGPERLAYIPLAVAPRLASLTDTDYAHQYSVDGAPVVVDAHGRFPRCGGGSCWGTILAGGLRGGGQGIYALDVTDPSLFDENKADKVVLWEFTDADDADLGYTYSRPNIVRLHNGKWAAVFGNGYNNTEDDDHKSLSGDAVLYVVDLSDGSLIRKIDTGYGTAQDPTGLDRPNGLATVAAADLDGDYITDVVYAGDLFGNLWKFDLRGSDPDGWGSGYEKSAKPTPLFTACAGSSCGGTNVQPITIQPQVGPHPTGQGALVYFGTGKYLEQNDVDDQHQVTQSFYAIWDKDDGTTAGFGRGALLKQEITQEVTQAFGSASGTVRVTSDHSITWHLGPGIPAGNPAPEQLGWYIDLIDAREGKGNQGERVLTEPVLHAGRIVFVTMRPTGGDPCSSAASSWVMDLDAKDGSRWTRPTLDLNGDGAFDLGDMADTDGDGAGDAVVSGLKLGVGIATTPVFRGRGGKEKMTIFGSGKASGGGGATAQGQDIDRVPPPYGRQSWRELRP